MQSKHKVLFDELTLSRSKEGMARREVARVKEQLRQHDNGSDEELDNDEVEVRDTHTSGYGMCCV